MNKIKILLEDDNEVLGNGLGHPALRQYLPTLKYIDLLNKFNIRGTFFIDMSHYIFLKDNIKTKDFEFQVKCIEETIIHLIKNKMDVQLHLHSQWVDAEIRNNNTYVTKIWNIGELREDKQRKLFKNALEATTNLTKDFNNHKINAFKAGSWGLQPFKNLYDIFIKNNIKLVFGPIKGLLVKDLNIDYRKLHSDFFPYYASKENINKVSNKKKIVIFPLTPTYLNWFDLCRYIFEIKFLNLFNKKEDIDLSKIDKTILNLNPLKGKDKLNFDLKPFKTHLKINSQRYWYLKKTFDRSYKLIKKSKHKYKLMVIETHTKDFKNNFNEIEKFFSYIVKKYDDIEFITTIDLLKDINSGKLVPLNE